MSNFGSINNLTTLFTRIGQKFGLIHTNIAPVETDATSSANAYSVDDQLILNDVLYTVTSAIAIGDALTVGTNIVASDNITTQISNRTYTAGSGINIDNKEINSDIVMFTGTTSEWDALSVAEKIVYTHASFTDDETSTATVDDVPTEDSDNLVKSGGVFSALDGKADASDITTLSETVATNTANIATNTENIATNTTNIAANTESISTINSNLENYALLTQITNPNLLDNPWFTVNQRGESSYNVSGYTVDRWETPDGNLVVTVNDGYITLTTSTGSTDFTQTIAYDDLAKYLLGKKVTLSGIFDGTLRSFSFTLPSSVPSKEKMIGQLVFSSHFDLRLYVNASGNILVKVGTLSSVSSEVSVNLTCIKLELGEISTLAMDTVPNYTTELLKCQRYYHIYATQSLRPSNMYDCVPVMASTPSQGTITIDSTTYYYNSADL